MLSLVSPEGDVRARASPSPVPDPKMIQDKLIFKSASLSLRREGGVRACLLCVHRTKKPTWWSTLWVFRHVGLLCNEPPGHGRVALQLVFRGQCFTLIQWWNRLRLREKYTRELLCCAPNRRTLCVSPAAFHAAGAEPGRQPFVLLSVSRGTRSQASTGLSFEQHGSPTGVTVAYCALESSRFDRQ